MLNIRYADLFCGLGAFHQAFKRDQSFECVLASDIDAGARRVYERNHGIAPVGDIRKVDAESFPEVDLICSGIPCQSFSIAGSRKGFGDNNGNLFWEVARILGRKRPKMVIIENVKNLLSHDGGNTYATMRDALVGLGYRVFSKVLDSSRYGSPQCRQRVFIVGVLDGDFRFPPGSADQVSVNSILGESSAVWNTAGYELAPKRGAPRPFKPRVIFDVISKKTGKGGRQGERVYDPSCCGVTVCASSGGPGAKTGLYRVGTAIRRLNAEECLSMFGFPRDFDFLDIPEEKRMFYLGNSIVVNVIEAMIPLIKDIFSEQKHR
jgi:DNA (cytosine-5)-methyltransferase 1